MTHLPDPIRLLLAVTVFSALCGEVSATTAANTAAVPSDLPAPPTHGHKIRAADADNHVVQLNRPGMISVVVGTNEDSQDAARQAGKAMYPFQGRPDFQLVVVVDLRGSIATWVPSIVLGRMRGSLDLEAEELQPWFLKNGNKGNPRNSLHVVPEFKDSVCPQLGWAQGGDDLRAIIFGVDGRELERIDKVKDMTKFQADVHAAIQAQIDLEQAKDAEAAKTPGSKLLQPVYHHPPIIQYTPIQNKDN